MSTTACATITSSTRTPSSRPRYWRSVTILCGDSGIADALSTALFCMTQEDGQALLDEFGAEAMWVTQDGEMSYSPGFRAVYPLVSRVAQRSPPPERGQRPRKMIRINT